MNEVEGIGTAVTGSLIARAVEPAGGEVHQGGDVCLNCKADLIGEYCHHCGQQGYVHRSLKAFWHDLLHGVLHFEGKIWRTLPLLAWRPGELTRRYVEGERAKFVSPLALFLFSVFLMFAVITAFGGIGLPDSRSENFQRGMQEAITENEQTIAGLEKQRAQAAARGANTAALDAQLKEAREEISMLRLMKERGVTEASLTRASDDVPQDLGWFSAAYNKAKANPALLIYKIQNNAYKFSWALIPISVPFVWLLFAWRRKYKLYDHSVFVTYSIAFMTLLVVVLGIAVQLGLPSSVMVLSLIFIPPIHMYRQLRGAYELSRFRALWRTVFLVVFAIIAASLFLTLLVAMGALGRSAAAGYSCSSARRRRP